MLTSELYAQHQKWKHCDWFKKHDIFFRYSDIFFVNFEHVFPVNVNHINSSQVAESCLNTFVSILIHFKPMFHFIPLEKIKVNVRLKWFNNQRKSCIKMAGSNVPGSPCLKILMQGGDVSKAYGMFFERTCFRVNNFDKI